ncbi:MAG: aspartyl/asparaginyl beta-hydroxylase domain-containing protein [Pseudomonadota bacterium]
MDIPQPLRDLGAIDTQALAKAILSLDTPVWLEEQVRQKRYSEVHYNTQSVIVIFCDHDDWPNIDVVKGRGWDRLADYAVPIMHELIARHYTPGGTIIRAMAAKLTAGTTITPHTDSHPSFHHSHRIHVPITTNNKVRFMIDGRPHRLQVGNAYEINNQLRHGVMNGGDEDRITFIFDYIPGGAEEKPA